MRRTLFITVALLLATSCQGEERNGTSASSMIRLADVPQDAPRFSDYPSPTYHGKPVAVDVKSHPRSRQFATVLRQGASRGANFAGHYAVVKWGCGTGCVEYAIVDVASGAVFHPENFRTTESMAVDYAALEPPEGALVKYHPESRLLIVIGGINSDPARRGISYFVWEHERLQRIRFVPRPYEGN